MLVFPFCFNGIMWNIKSQGRFGREIVNSK